ncbi:hypothetical protein [Paraflavitalea speifideaquila]|uniref:hypothetical protein n=1 Tax=Paraflavitalea speifideaquila TaxID=3076558 RepID=UPI0028E7EEAC|nr:hypothetical protein [Paraflavitalea speifideiaquila]
MSVLVEGGAQLLQSFIDADYWDEARIITNDTLFLQAGIPAPVLNTGTLVSTEKLATDTISIINREKQEV